LVNLLNNILIFMFIMYKIIYIKNVQNNRTKGQQNNNQKIYCDVYIFLIFIYKCTVR